MKITKSVRALATALMVSLPLATPVQAQYTIGDALISRPYYDGYASFIFISPYTFAAAATGQTVSSVSIFDGFVGRDFTPLILGSNGGGSWTVTGAGTQRVVAASGAQTYAFGLVGGSDVVTPTTYVGFLTGAQGGVIPFDFDGDSQYYTFSPNGGGSATVGYTFQEEGVTDRAYSIQFSTTAVTATPEPSTVVLTASGLIALVGFTRRRRS